MTPPPRQRFVILEHDHPTLHWDFMLEHNGVLRTWRLPELPGDSELVAEQIADHRLAYLDYEGPVSGERGSVKRWATGEFEMILETSDRLEMRLIGQAISATIRMTRTSGPLWRFEWRSHADHVS